MRMASILLLGALVLSGCGDTAGSASPSEGAAETWQDVRPASYLFDLEATCGERSLIGTFRVWVSGDRVERYEVIDSYATSLRPQDFPTIDDLFELADTGAPAEVEIEIGTDGIPTWVSVDHQPDAIDDEECYRVSGFRALD